MKKSLNSFSLSLYLALILSLTSPLTQAQPPTPEECGPDLDCRRGTALCCMGAGSLGTGIWLITTGTSLSIFGGSCLSSVVCCLFFCEGRSHCSHSNTPCWDYFPDSYQALLPPRALQNAPDEKNRNDVTVNDYRIPPIPLEYIRPVIEPLHYQDPTDVNPPPPLPYSSSF